MPLWPYRDLVASLKDAPHRHLWKYRDPSQITELIIHHTAGPEGQTPESIHVGQQHRNFGTPERPLYPSRIVYHYGVAIDGTQYKFNFGMWKTWHCPDHNWSGLSVVLIGNRDAAPPFDAQYASTLDLCGKLLRAYNVAVDRVFLHRDFFATACPGRFINRAQLRKDIAPSSSS